jgi:hypothetical protein
MRIYRFLLCVLTIAGMVVLTIALRNPAARWVGAAQNNEQAPTFTGLEKVPVDGTATKLVQQAVARISGTHTGWLESGVWMKTHLPELSFAGAGRYVRAPGQRFRLELEARLEGDSAPRSAEINHCTILSVSNGREMWTASRIGTSGWRDVVRVQVSKILDAPDSPAQLPQVRSEFLTGAVFQGVELLLRNLNGQIDWVRREERAQNVRLTGRWKEGVLGGLVEPKQPWPEALPRFCRLTLSGEKLWPSRLEWWGPQKDGGPDCLLAEVEFRDPVFGVPVPPAECVGLFAFDPGQAVVQDLTPIISAGLSERAKQLTPGK